VNRENVEERVRGRAPGTAALIAVAVVLGAACGDGPTDPDGGTGALAVTTTTEGSTLDPDGYRLAAAGDTISLPLSGTGVIDGLPTGRVEAEISDVQRNCRTGGRTATARISAGDTAELSLSVACDTALLGKVVFVSDRDGGGDTDLWVMNPDGSDATRLTDHSATEGGPEVSPDGTRIAFWSDRSGNQQELFTVAADGSDLRQLTAHPDQDSGPAWSPDGGRIAFISSRGGAQSVFIAHLANDSLVQLTRDTAQELTVDWSPDGTRLVYNSDGGGALSLYTVAPGGSELREIPDTGQPPGYTPAWGPGNSGIAFSAGSSGDFDIETVATDGTDRRVVLDSDAADLRPAWSPDGERLVFESDRDGNSEIYSMAADGTDLIRLTENPGCDAAASYTPPPDGS